MELSKAVHGRVVVIGSVNEDLVLTVDRLPSAGATVLSSSLSTSPGGKGANQAVAASRAGARVSFVGSVGRDERGERLVGGLARAGVDVSTLTRGDDASGLAVVVVAEDGDNVIVVAPGANAALPATAADRIIGALGEHDVVVVQCEIATAVVERVASRRHGRRARVVLNLAPYVRIDAAVLAEVDLLIVNESEARALLGGDDATAASDLAFAVRTAIGCPAIVTLGGLGSVLSDANGSVVAVPAVPVAQVVDTTGAGDVYVGALAARLAAGDRVVDAMAFAGDRAAASVGVRGAQSTHPPLHPVT